jgi:hypothetical protein
MSFVVHVHTEAAKALLVTHIEGLLIRGSEIVEAWRRAG